MTVNLGYLFQIQFACQHHYVSKLCIKAQCFHIRNIQLCGEMHFLIYLPCITHHSHIRSNHCRDTGCFCRIYNGTHQRQVLVVNNGINGEITFHPVLIARMRYFLQVVDGESIRRTGAHIQVLNAEIDGIGTRLDSRCE